MPPENYCHGCHDTHKWLTCAEHETTQLRSPTMYSPNPQHRAEPNDWTRHIEAKREREIANMHRIYAARVIPTGGGRHRAEDQEAA